MRVYLYGALVALVAAPTALAARSWDDCRYEAERSATLDAAGVRLLDLQAGAGSLKVEGKPGLTAVRIRGKACASSRDLLDQIKLDTRRSGTTIYAKANVQDHDFHFSWRMNEYARLDVVVEVPEGMNARIDDGSGEMELSGLGDTDIDDGSGGIVATNLASAHVDDGSGNIDLRNIHGKVDIDDGSGSIELHDVTGTITIDDGSGSITVGNVGGDFIVTGKGSGSIDYSNVRGRVELPRKFRHRQR